MLSCDTFPLGCEGDAEDVAETPHMEALEATGVSDQDGPASKSHRAGMAWQRLDFGDA